MSHRTGTNKGVCQLLGSKSEYLRFILSPLGAAANFSHDDDLSGTVVNDSAFGEADSCVWRLQATAHVDGTRLTAMDNTGVAITTYSRVVNAAFASTYTVGLVFGTAVGYQLTADRCAADGTVLENIISLKFTGGGAGEHAEEAVILDLGVA